MLKLLEGFFNLILVLAIIIILALCGVIGIVLAGIASVIGGLALLVVLPFMLLFGGK